MVRPVAPVPIDLDRRRKLLLTFEAMKAFEDETGTSLLQPGSWLHMGTRQLRALLWACLLYESPSLTPVQVGALIQPRDIHAVTERVFEACERAAFPAKEASERSEPGGDGAEELTWLRLWSVGVIDLGLTPEGFWAQTPVEFDALVKRNNLKLERRDFGFGVVAATIANVNRDPKVRPQPFTAADFMPTASGKPRRTKQTWQEQFDLVKMLNAMYGGTEQITETETTPKTPEPPPD